MKLKDLGRNSVTSPKVKDGSLFEQDFAPGQLPAGPPGPQGPTGADGEDATNLFAYIQDPGDPGLASIGYGSGVVGVTDPAGDLGNYTVTFNRSVANCVVIANVGLGDPPGSSASADPSYPFINMPAGGPETVAVGTITNPGTAVDSSFLITAFC